MKGYLVKSTKGRDKDRVYIVYRIIDKDFVELVNGDTRKIDNPKKKRVKHLEVVDKSQVLDEQSMNDIIIKKLCKNLGGKNA